MAEIKLTANTRDAQQKVQKLRRDVDNLDRQCRKPKRITITGGLSGGLSGLASGKSGGIRNLGTMVKSGAKGIGLAASTAVGTFIGSAIGEVVSALMAFSPAILRATSGITGVGMRLKKFMTVLETYGHPQEEALKRANTLDALDDERRNHNTATLSQEAAYRQAWEEQAGTFAPMMLDKVSDLMGQAKSGVMSEMLAAWGTLDLFGLTQEDLQKPVWEVIAKMLQAYNAAGQDGMNELEPAMQKLFGSRYMGVVRKMGDGSSYITRAQELAAYLQERGFDDPANLDAAAKAELLQGLAKMEDLLLPATAHTFALEGAQNEYDTARLKTQMLGATATADLAPLFDEVTGDLMGTLGVAKEIPVIGSMISPFLPDENEEEGTEGSEEGSDSSITDKVTDLLGDAVNRVLPRQKPSQSQEYVDPRSKVPGIILDEKPLGDGRIQYTSLDISRALDIMQPARGLWNSMFSDEPKEEPKKEETPDPSQTHTNVDVVKAIDNLANVVTKNTNSTIMLNSTLTNTKAVAANGTNTDVAVFV